MVKPRENRVPIMMADSELTAVDDWRYKNRVATRSEAIRRLCRIALIQEELKPSINETMKELIDAVMLLANETLSDRPRTPEEALEVRGLASEVFGKTYSLYDKLVEQTVRLGGLSDGEKDLREELDWEKRAADFLAGKSFFQELRDSPEAMAVINEEAKKRRSLKKEDEK